jgi:hypothetical protein
VKWRAAALALALLAACSHSVTPRASQATATTTTTSTSTTVPATTSTSLVLARPCAAEGLDVGFGAGGAAAGTASTRISLTNTSESACSLSGPPTFVTGQTDDGKALEATLGMSQIPLRPGNLERGTSGEVVIDTGDVCEERTDPSKQLRYKQIRIGLPGGGSIFLGDFTIDGTCFVHVSNLGLEDH